jgi:hypothetical protein
VLREAPSRPVRTRATVPWIAARPPRPSPPPRSGWVVQRQTSEPPRSASKPLRRQPARPSTSVDHARRYSNRPSVPQVAPDPAPARPVAWEPGPDARGTRSGGDAGQGMGSPRPRTTREASDRPRPAAGVSGDSHAALPRRSRRVL